MDVHAPDSLEGFLIYLGVAVLSIPATGGLVCIIDSIYSGVKSLIEKNSTSKDKGFKELYQTNFQKFLG
jgi:hypothetical protein